MDLREGVLRLPKTLRIRKCRIAAIQNHIPPGKSRRFFLLFLKIWTTSTRLCCFRLLRFRSTAICDFVLRFSGRNLKKKQRFENGATRDWFFWDAMKTWWTFRIFLIFFCSGEGSGSPWRQEGAGGRFSAENPRRGGVLPREAGGGGAGRVSAGNFGGVELNIFFRGRNAHQEEVSFTKLSCLRSSLRKDFRSTGNSFLGSAASDTVSVSSCNSIRRQQLMSARDLSFVWDHARPVPSDTKLLLTKNYSKIIIFQKLRISHVIL